jgi:hypothetical protein
MRFTILSAFRDVETIAIGHGIRELPRLKATYGAGRWRKRKGYATVELDGRGAVDAELHWYECHGIGKKEIRLLRFWER